MEDAGEEVEELGTESARLPDALEKGKECAKTLFTITMFCLPAFTRGWVESHFFSGAAVRHRDRNCRNMARLPSASILCSKWLFPRLDPRNVATARKDGISVFHLNFFAISAGTSLSHALIKWVSGRKWVLAF